MRKEGIGYLPDLDNLEDTIYSILEFFTQERSRVLFFDYITKNYGKKSDSTVRLVENTLCNYGLIRETQDYVYIITPEGRQWLEQGTDEDLIRIIHEHVQYIGELLLQLEDEKLNREVLQNRALKYYGLEFNNTDITRRLQILKSTGMIRVNRHKEYEITKKGKDFVSQVSLNKQVSCNTAEKDSINYSQNKITTKAELPTKPKVQTKKSPVYEISTMDEKTIIDRICEMLKYYMAERKLPYKVTRNGKIIGINCKEHEDISPDLLVYQENGEKKSPRWIIEIVSAKSRDKDFSDKLFYYWQTGVSECWLADELSKNVYIFNWKDGMFNNRKFTDTIRNVEFPGLDINFHDLMMEQDEIVEINLK